MSQAGPPPSRRRWATIERSDPVLMTTRARVLVGIVALRNFLLGASLLIVPDRFVSTSYAVIRAVPWDVWGVGMLTVGVVCVVAAVTMDEATARVGVGGSATLSCVWAVGFASALTSPAVNPAGVIIWASLTAKDFVIVSYPMASPFEPVIRAVSRLRAPGGGPR